MATRRSVLSSGAASIATAILPSRSTFAQSFPSKPIRIIVPFPPGGPADTAVRIVQGGMEKTLGQSIVVENVAGAAGAIGAQRVKQAEPDGYTLLQAASPHSTNAAVKPAANVDLRRDFEPIGIAGASVFTLCASKESGITSLADLIAKAKARPDELKIGSVGIGSAHHLVAEMLKSAAGIELNHVAWWRPKARRLQCSRGSVRRWPPR